MSKQETETTVENDLQERVAIAICEAYGEDWNDRIEDGTGLRGYHPGLPAKADFREMAAEAIAVVRQWDAGK